MRAQTNENHETQSLPKVRIRLRYHGNVFMDVSRAHHGYWGSLDGAGNSAYIHVLDEERGGEMIVYKIVRKNKEGDFVSWNAHGELKREYTIGRWTYTDNQILSQLGIGLFCFKRLKDAIEYDRDYFSKVILRCDGKKVRKVPVYGSIFHTADEVIGFYNKLKTDSKAFMYSAESIFPLNVAWASPAIRLEREKHDRL